MCLSLSCPVYHLWIDGFIKPGSPSFCCYVLLLPLNDKILSLAASQLVMSSSSPLSWQIAKFHLFCLLLCPVCHLWIVNILSLVISNRLYPVSYLWIDDYLISTFLCHHVQFITSEWQIFKLGGFSISYAQFITSEPRDNKVSFFSSLSPLNSKTLNSGVSQSIVSRPSPLNRWCPNFISQSLVDFPLLSCPVHHLWITNTLSLIILNWLCPVPYLWTDEYPILLSLCRYVQFIIFKWQNFRSDNS